MAFIHFNSWPWSVVYLDGQKLHGTTPLYKIPVTTGTHRIRFVNTELGRNKEVFIYAPVGKIITVAVSLPP